METDKWTEEGKGAVLTSVLTPHWLQLVIMNNEKGSSGSISAVSGFIRQDLSVMIKKILTRVENL